MENQEGTGVSMQTATLQSSAPSQQSGLLHIDKDFIAALPLLQYKGKIVLVEDPKTAKEAVRELRSEKILGFDTETRPSFRAGNSYFVSLVQLCGASCAYLFRLDYCGGVPVLFPIFENKNILKVGVAVKEDVRHLKIRAPFDDAGFVDASTYTRHAKIENTGLRALCAHFLGGRISKNAQVSNWSARQLTPQQVVYAATDAWTSRELFLKLQSLGIAPKNIVQDTLFTPPARPTPPLRGGISHKRSVWENDPSLKGLGPDGADGAWKSAWGQMAPGKGNAPKKRSNTERKRHPANRKRQKASGANNTVTTK